MKAKDWLTTGIIVLIVVVFVAVLVGFIVGDIQCSTAGWTDGTWYIVDTLCEKTITEKLSVIKAGQ